MCAAPKSQVLSQEIVMSCLTLSQVICYGTKLGVFSWLYSFSRMIVVGFLLGPRPMNPQVLGHFSSVWSRFHLIEGALNPIKTWLATARIFVLLLYQPIFQSDYRVYSWMLLMIDFLLWKYAKYPSSTMNGMGETSRLPAWFLHLQQWGLTIRLWKVTYSIGSSL